MMVKASWKHAHETKMNDLKLSASNKPTKMDG